jgi:uncharacterized protein YbjT (DUF2867 family)
MQDNAVRAIDASRARRRAERHLRGEDSTLTVSNEIDLAPTLVIGGTGKTGRRVAERLEACGLPVRIGTRSADIPFDWNDPSTWAQALRGAGAVYITYFPDLAVEGAVEAVRALGEQALALGVRRQVLLSGRGEEEAQRAEQALQASGADWTIVRCSWFSQNFSENYLLEPIIAGEVVLPAGDVAEPFVDTEDIADVVVAALTEAGHGGKLYELTGPRLLTFDEAISEIAAATRREIRFTPVSLEGYGAILVQAGVPGDFVALLTYLFTEVLDGRNAYLADGVQQALGRPPRDFADYARATAATGVWSPQA